MILISKKQGYIQMKSKKIFKPLVLIILGILCCFLLFQLILFQCVLWTCSPHRDFRIADLEFPPSFFPTSFQVSNILPLSETEGGIEDGIQMIYWSDMNGIGGMEIQRYSTLKRAKYYFSDFTTYYTNRSTGEKWKQATDIKFLSGNADEQIILYGDYGSGLDPSYHDFRWAAVFRYKEYVISIRASNNPPMTPELFERMLEYIDQEMSERLYSD
jgi:hypothetical protein